MDITLNFVGLLKEKIGTDSVSFEICENAVFSDLLEEFNNRFGNKLPKSLWDREKREFRPGILCVGEGRDLESGDEALMAGETISIVVHMAGG